MIFIIHIQLSAVFSQSYYDLIFVAKAFEEEEFDRPDQTGLPTRQIIIDILMTIVGKSTTSSKSDFTVRDYATLAKCSSCSLVYYRLPQLRLFIRYSYTAAAYM